MSPWTKPEIQSQYERLVDAELMVELLDGALVGQRPEDRPAGIAREHLPGEEHDQAQDPERDQGEAQALGDVGEHA
jgi:hypothetical protein